MNKNFFITLCLGLALAGGVWAQQKAQIRIKKNINGVESQETREVIIDENNSLEDVLRDLNARPTEQEGLIDQQIEINIISEGDYAKLKQGSPSLRLPGFSEALSPQHKPTLGVMLRESACNRQKCEREREVVITEVVANSPAAKAGLQPGDIILAINKQDISSSQQVIQHVRNLTGGGELKLVVSRSGKKKKVKAIIPPASQFESRTNQFNLLL
jgi:C-terminal processing protease CtpA/Prc